MITQVRIRQLGKKKFNVLFRVHARISSWYTVDIYFYGYYIYIHIYIIYLFIFVFVWTNMREILYGIKNL